MLPLSNNQPEGPPVATAGVAARPITSPALPNAKAKPSCRRLASSRLSGCRVQVVLRVLELTPIIGTPLLGQASGNNPKEKAPCHTRQGAHPRRRKRTQAYPRHHPPSMNTRYDPPYRVAPILVPPGRHRKWDFCPMTQI